MRIPTVTIDRDGTAVVINRSDFLPHLDRLWGSAPAAPASEQASSKFIKEPETPTGFEKDELIAALQAASIPFDRRWGVQKLRNALEPQS